jgi:malate dehydrogenase (oxaloacetate-decarboxylating)(NADP+)
MVTKNEALEYHSKGRPGKLEVVTSKPCITQRDLSLAYTPGVADPCLEIEKDPNLAYRYTGKGNLVGVVSNGTAVLGLGNIGALAGKPVMEGKGVLFKRFAGIDVFDIELNTEDPDEIIRAVQMLEPTFGGINLEDIKAPECFYIEETLKKTVNIPVFHDDQHGTAIISAAALTNALELAGKKFEDVKVVFSGAGAAGVACAKLYISLGVRKENLMMVDSKGVISTKREDYDRLPDYKKYFAVDTDAKTLADAMDGADVFAGVSVAGVLKPEMLKNMKKDPIIFAMANPTPEIMYEEAVEARPDVIMATGRSDYPNQVNNVLGFPFIFRGALDVKATQINEEMKKAAVKALADLAKLDVPDSVLHAYNLTSLTFGREYIIPKPFDPRVLTHVASAVARAACETGVAREPISDFEAYEQSLIARLGKAEEMLYAYTNKAIYINRKKPVRIVFPEGSNSNIIRAAHRMKEEKLGVPILLGNKKEILDQMAKMDLNPELFNIVDVRENPRLKDYARDYFDRRQRKGITLTRAMRHIGENPNFQAAAMVMHGDADAVISGEEQHYSNALRPVLQVFGHEQKAHALAGMYIVIPKDGRPYFFSDCTVNINPSAEELSEIAILTSDYVKELGITPKMAMLSFSNFGSARYPESNKVAQATRLIKEKRPDIVVDGEMQASTALDEDFLREIFPFSSLQEKANVLIFPTLDAGNIAYKLLDKLAEARVIGPILLGIKYPIQILQRNVDVDTIVNMAVFSILHVDHLRNSH